MKRKADTRTVAVDSSIVVKWFKKGEDFESEALRLRDDVLSSTVVALASELIHLEVCRALVKVGYPYGKVDEAYSTLNEITDLGFMRSVSTATVKDKAKDFVRNFNLYVSDALSLATAVVSSSDLLTEDRHLLKEEIKNMMRKNGLRVVGLKEEYPKL